MKKDILDRIADYIQELEVTNAELLEALERIIKADHSLGHGLTCQFCIDKAKQAIEKAKGKTNEPT